MPGASTSCWPRTPRLESTEWARAKSRFGGKVVTHRSCQAIPSNTRHCHLLPPNGFPRQLLRDLTIAPRPRHATFLARSPQGWDRRARKMPVLPPFSLIALAICRRSSGSRGVPSLPLQPRYDRPSGHPARLFGVPRRMAPQGPALSSASECPGVPTGAAQRDSAGHCVLWSPGHRLDQPLRCQGVSGSAKTRSPARFIGELVRFPTC